MNNLRNISFEVIKKGLIAFIFQIGPDNSSGGFLRADMHEEVGLKKGITGWRRSSTGSYHC